MISSAGDRRRRSLASAAVVLFALTGCAVNAPALAEATRAPSLAASSTPSTATPSRTLPVTAPSGTPRAQLSVMAESQPVSLRIPSIGAQSDLLSLGLQDNGSLEVPPGDPGAPAAWYSGSPTPGERGPAVLLGHVNATDGGPGVFAGLRELKAGDTIEVTRKDGTTAVFTVERGEQYSKDAFPTQKVYGNTEGSELRLITCDGYDPQTGEFDDNYVVYAQLVI